MEEVEITEEDLAPFTSEDERELAVLELERGRMVQEMMKSDGWKVLSEEFTARRNVLMGYMLSKCGTVEQFLEMKHAIGGIDSLFTLAENHVRTAEVAAARLSREQM